MEDVLGRELGKRCRCCGELKPLSEFWKSRNSKTGYQAYCKGCLRIRKRNRLESPLTLAELRLATRILGIEYISNLFDDILYNEAIRLLK